MTSAKSPAFQWYPRDYLVDENTVVMTLEEEGAYRRLLDYCWLEGSLPDDMAALATMCKRITPARMTKLWIRIGPCFRKKGDRWVHPRLEIERRKQRAQRKAKSDAGRKGAEATHRKGNRGTATLLPVAESGSSSAVAFATSVVPPGSPPEGDPSEGRRGTKRRRARMPADWTPNEGHRALATRERVDVERQAERFRSHHEAKGTLMLDWDRAFTTWLLRAKEFGRQRSGSKANEGHWSTRL